MKLLVFILNKTDALEEILEAWAAKKLTGATILQSNGMMHALVEYDEEVSFLGSLRSMLNPGHEESRTIFSVLKEEEIPLAIEAIESVIGDLNQPNTGVVFTVPVDFKKGMYGDR